MLLQELAIEVEAPSLPLPRSENLNNLKFMVKGNYLLFYQNTKLFYNFLLLSGTEFRPQRYKIELSQAS